MSTSIEIWRSAAGSSFPDDFSLLTTVPDGNPWSFLDSPTRSGNLYIYYARRKDNVTGLYSPFVGPAYCLGPYGGNMLQSFNPNPIPGWVQYAGFAIEPSPGAAVKAARMLNLISLDPDKANGMKRIEREDYNGFADIVGLGNGDAEYKYKGRFSLTPEGCDNLLSILYGAPITNAVAIPATPAAPTVVNVGAAGAVTAVYKIYAQSKQGDSLASATTTNTTTNATLNGTNYNTISWAPVAGATSYVVVKGTTVVGITNQLALNDQGGTTFGTYAAPASPTGNTQLWTPTSAALTGTLSLYQGPNLNANPMVDVIAGCYGDKWTITYDKMAKNPLSVEIDIVALAESRMASLSAVGLNTATLDTLPAYGPAFAILNLGGACVACSKYHITGDRGRGGERVSAFTGYAGDVAFGQKPNHHSATATLYFNSDTEFQRFWGVVNQSGQYAQINNVLYFPVEMTVANPVNGGGIINQFTIRMGYASYTANPNVKTDPKTGVMTQDVEIRAIVDPTTGYALSLAQVNSLSNATIITPGTAITGINFGAIHPYSN
jgi:hypothetical protein